ncbi:Presenilins-associated rhomboid-like protein [Schistosoma japonicum]|uniref:rhomboid protease n=1 Tax=Schistosoma japonicum TaxID=6182 RepID=A0A4Z2DCQ3_SCHJA|nr:Presenilins-associated rhomboid-like protein, mitochondrial [Schistosoma japonicum]TNN13980.1 Presenilins-associated rhomboid-like protein [Schistosoma japonicum]
MYVLHSFTLSVISLIGVEDFVSVFIAGGIFSNYVSLINRLLRKSTFPSLGASGGICAIIGAFSILQPNARLCIPFVVDIIPHSFQASSAAWAILCFEIFGTIFLARRSALDHAAHAGGLIFGMMYGMNGAEYIWERRRAVLSWWKNIRDKK